MVSESLRLNRQIWSFFMCWRSLSRVSASCGEAARASQSGILDFLSLGILGFPFLLGSFKFSSFFKYFFNPIFPKPIILKTHPRSQSLTATQNPFSSSKITSNSEQLSRFLFFLPQIYSQFLKSHALTLQPPLAVNLCNRTLTLIDGHKEVICLNNAWIQGYNRQHPSRPPEFKQPHH